MFLKMLLKSDESVNHIKFKQHVVLQGLSTFQKMTIHSFMFATCALRASAAMPQAQLTLMVPWSHLCMAIMANCVVLSWESRFTSPHAFSHTQRTLKEEYAGFLVQNTGKTLSLFRLYHRQMLFFSQSLSHLGKHFATRFLECRRLIVYLICKSVYHKLTKIFQKAKEQNR